MIYDILTANDIYIWLQEKYIFVGQNSTEFAAGSTVTFWSDRHGSESAPFATYTCASDNSIKIDLTDYIRTFNPYYLHFGGSSFETPVGIEIMAYKGLIDPLTMLIPYSPLRNAGLLIMPPSKMLVKVPFENDIISMICLDPDTYNGDTIMWRSSSTKEWIDITLSITAGGVLTIKGTYGQEENDLFFELKIGDEIYKYRPCFVSCNQRVAMMRWKDATGIATKQHPFYISEQKIASANDYSLETPENTPNAVKGREESLTLYIDKLDAYDLWYYSDILTSSNVCLEYADGVNSGPWKVQVEVTTKNVLIPSGDKADGKIEFEILVKRYDAVTM